ncbi:UxaA family hydrolase [Chloroflexota bacterium]
MMQKAVVFNVKDNVATALSDLKAGDIIELGVGDSTVTINLAADVPFGHKFSLTGIKADSTVIKYGEVIGIATLDISPGDYVHVHNVNSARARGDITGGRLS